ncbi:MAG: hypothetical protein ACOZBZ_03255 [Patescibacteria group bacterium]
MKRSPELSKLDERITTEVQRAKSLTQPKPEPKFPGSKAARIVLASTIEGLTPKQHH